MNQYISTKSFKVNDVILDDNEKKLFSAAVTNYLFAREHSQQHLDKFTSKQIESAGLTIAGKSKDKNLVEK